jgi:hypothetical protein
MINLYRSTLRPVKSYHFFLLLFCYLSTLQGSVYAQSPEQWILRKESKGIKIFTRKVNQEGLREFKAITVMQVPIHTLEVVLDDEQTHPQWHASAHTVELIEVLSPNEKIVHYTADLPWPINDRDMVIQIKKETKKSRISYYLSSVPTKIEEQEDYVRMEVAGGSWQLTRASSTSTQITYRFFANPEGSLPGWVINYFMVSSPYETLLDLSHFCHRRNDTFIEH